MSKNDKAPVEKAQKQFQGQHDGEEVVMVFRQHPLVMRKALIGGLLLIMLAVLPFDFPQIYTVDWAPSLLMKIMWGIIAFVLFMWFHRWVGWFYTVYIVTSERILVIKQRGFFDRKVDEWQLEVISNMNYHVDGFQAVLFGYGDITARTYIGDLEMKKIHKPAEIHAELVKAVRRGGGGSTQAPN